MTHPFLSSKVKSRKSAFKARLVAFQERFLKGRVSLKCSHLADVLIQMPKILSTNHLKYRKQALNHTANKSPDKWRDKMTFIWSFIWENHQHIFELSRLVASDTSWFYQNFIRCLNINRLFIGKNLLSAIYQGLVLLELINLKTFVSILSELWGFFIYQSEKRVSIILVTKVHD
jgi:hypothetical protein